MNSFFRKLLIFIPTLAIMALGQRVGILLASSIVINSGFLITFVFMKIIGLLGLYIATRFTKNLERLWKGSATVSIKDVILSFASILILGIGVGLIYIPYSGYLK